MLSAVFLRGEFRDPALAGEKITVTEVRMSPDLKAATAFVARLGRSDIDALLPTPVFRAGTWLLVCIAICAFGWRRRETTEGAFALGVCGSAVFYVMTYLPFGVASGYRYAYWAALAGLTGAVVVFAPRTITTPERVPAPPPRTA